jgi:predicted acylesterase/phospholipase RssA
LGIARGKVSAIAVGVMAAALCGCASLERLPAPPPAVDLVAAPEIAGCLPPMGASPDTASTAANLLDPCRFLVARDTTGFAAETRASVGREQAWWTGSGHTGPLPPATTLALSGGGDDGAFGAGLLVGWTEAGDRPEFKVVTGISTGALIAPFAFLGPKYDPDLKAVYTTISQKDVFKSRGLLSGLFSDAFSDTSPLARVIASHVDQPLLDAVAGEYAKGRILLIGTSDLDTLEPVIWNMTAIAASRDPQALNLFRQILLASSAIPGAFPPVMIEVESNGVKYHEMHVDGGVEAQVFAYPPSVRISEAMAQQGVRRRQVLYVIRNSHFDPDWASVKRSTLPIITRSVSSLIENQGLGDLYQLYHLSHRDGIDFNLAYIPASFSAPRNGQFDTAYMQALFKTGEDMARAGYPWEKTPPGYDAPIKVTPRP